MAYVTMEEFQKYSNVYGDIILQQSYIDSAENIVNNYLNYSPLLHNYHHYLNGNGTHELQLKAKPVIAIHFLTVNGVSVPVSEFLNTNDEFIYYNQIFPTGVRNIEISYSAGWGTIPDNDVINEPLIPAVIRMTVLRIAALLQTESDGNIGITSKSFADSGSRTFISTINFDKYLIQLSPFKLIVI
jgi:hypothetical protein